MQYDTAPEANFDFGPIQVRVPTFGRQSQRLGFPLEGKRDLAPSPSLAPPRALYQSDCCFFARSDVSGICGICSLPSHIWYHQRPKAPTSRGQANDCDRDHNHDHDAVMTLCTPGPPKRAYRRTRRVEDGFPRRQRLRPLSLPLLSLSSPSLSLSLSKGTRDRKDLGTWSLARPWEITC